MTNDSFLYQAFLRDCPASLSKVAKPQYNTKMNQSEVHKTFGAPRTDGVFFAFGECRGKDWELARCNEALLHLLAEGTEPFLTKNDPLPAGISLPVLMNKAGLGPVFTALRNAPQKTPKLFHQGNLLYIFQWQIMPSDETNKAKKTRAFVLHKIPLNKTDDVGLASGQKINALFDSFHDGIWVTDSDGVTLRVNKTLENITGKAAAELVGHIAQPVQQGRNQANLCSRALEEKRPVTALGYTEDGKRLLHTSVPLFDDMGNVWRVVTCVRDIDTMKEMQNRLAAYELAEKGSKKPPNRKEPTKIEDFLVGFSSAARRMAGNITKAAKSEATTMILGETGTGKTIAAQTIHKMSARRQMPFIAINCGALPATLIESELFGYEKGAFTGAETAGKVGLFESAGSGTIFLDEIAELPLLLQAKLLHVLDGQTFIRVGGVKPIHLDARIIAATNRPLEELVAAGSFREDLYYRVNVLTVRVPPLRERLKDIPILSRHFLAEANKKNATTKGLHPEVLRCFAAYSWPGNVRELRATIEYLVAMSENSYIDTHDLPERFRPDGYAEGPATAEVGLKAILAAKERELIAKAIEETGSTWKAAKRLKISQASVARKAKRYRICAATDVNEA